jgi:kynurenine formamidase
MKLIDLSHVIEEDMSVFPSLPQPHIGVYLSHAESRSHYEERACFAVTHIEMVTSLGTYLDAPYHRHPGRATIDQLDLGQCVLAGVVVDVRNKAPREPIRAADLRDLSACGGAVLFCTGWDSHWKQPAYYDHPFLSADAVECIVEQAPSLVGIDVLNIDDPRDNARPAHTQLLRQDTLIVENLCRLEQLISHSFLFVAAPVKVRGAAAFPVRAFALVDLESGGVEV